MTSSDKPLYIDGKLVTATNAWRFVRARRPNAEASRERSSGWGGARNYSIVRDRTGGAPWCNASGDTAGEAWLKVARQMVEYDAKVAAEKQVLETVVATLTVAETPSALQAAALRYAAERLRQSSKLSNDERKRCAIALLELATETAP